MRASTKLLEAIKEYKRQTQEDPELTVYSFARMNWKAYGYSCSASMYGTMATHIRKDGDDFIVIHPQDAIVPKITQSSSAILKRHKLTPTAIREMIQRGKQWANQ